MFLNKLSKIRFCFKHFLNAFAEKSVIELGCGVSVPSAKKCKLFATPQLAPLVTLNVSLPGMRIYSVARSANIVFSGRF